LLVGAATRQLALGSAFGLPTLSGVPGGTVGLGSLLKIHFADRPIRDYRSAYMTGQEVLRQAIFNRGLLNRGVLAAGYGLMALSTPMTDADIDMVITAASDALEEVSASA
jgi:glutamate-1-semialdehyde 2,1-aminomutase